MTTGKSPLGNDRLEDDPFALFADWFEQAQQTEINDPNAMALASVDESGMPSVRIVLLKDVGADHFVFFTNYTSRKSAELLATKKAAFVIHWKSLRRQIRVVGSVTKASAEESDAYFATRSRASQIGAWASDQSSELATRQTLMDKVAEFDTAYPDEVPRPPHWGGFVISPQEIEFWADGDARLHDRFRYERNQAGLWQAQRLSP